MTSRGRCICKSISLGFFLEPSQNGLCHSYQQACSSVKIGLRKLEELGVPIQRPEDYFAEMVKTDDHMRKVIFFIA